ncbi:MAG: cation transporter [Ilumatobacter sp.]|nr:cation transporter [Ilumatobacter sp.]
MSRVLHDHDHDGHDHGHDHDGHDHDHGQEAQPPFHERAGAVRRAVHLNRISIGYNVVEAGVALAAGLAAGSISLLGFGLDSVVEVAASVILAWRLTAERRDGCTQQSDRVAVKAIALSFAALAAYVGTSAVVKLAHADRPEASVTGIVLTALSLVLMPWLAREKRRLAPLLGSRAQQAEAAQTSLCAWLSAVVLAGLVVNALAGWWWADPVAALAVAALAAREAVTTWRAESLADTCCA